LDREGLWNTSPRHSRETEGGYDQLLDGLDEGEFTEGHELDCKWRVRKEMAERRLSQEEAKGLLAKFE
jgi:hypothetical protein